MLVRVSQKSYLLIQIKISKNKRWHSICVTFYFCLIFLFNETNVSDIFISLEFILYNF